MIVAGNDLQQTYDLLLDIHQKLDTVRNFQSGITSQNSESIIENYSLKNDEKYKRINVILGVCPWFDFIEEEQAWVSNEYYGKIHPVEMFHEGLLVDFV